MNEGERPQHIDGAGAGGNTDVKCASSPESTSPTGGNGCPTSTSSSTIANASSTTVSTSSAFTTCTSASTTSTATTIKGVDEDEIIVPGGEEDITCKNEKTNTMNSDSSTDTYFTPSASLQNLAGSSLSDNIRKIADSRPPEEVEVLLEEDEIVGVESGATSPSTSVTVTEVEDVSIRSKGDNEGVENNDLDNLSINSASELNAQRKKKGQQHKRQGSIGSQCSFSSNPENSQFKTADASSSDSDASRNSGTTRGLIFDHFSNGAGGDIGAEEIFGKYDQDAVSIQSDQSQLNTSVESVEFGLYGQYGEPSHGRKRDDGHSQRFSSPKVDSGSGSASPPLQLAQHHSIGAKPRVKKKMWYQQIFSTSYKTRSGDFKKIFKDLPVKERLIVDYSCALQKEILLQGRMYVSQNYVSFYANIFGWETQLSISFKEIESITKEKTALIIPNAIQISTMTEKNFFSSFVTRDTTYVMLFKLWQSALLEDNMTKKDIWKLVHTCYGEELGVTSEDESEELFCQPLVTTSSLITSSQVVDEMKSIIDSEEKGRSSPRGAPEITVDKYDDDHEQEEDDDEEPRIGSLEWCRLRTGSTGSSGSALSGLVCAGEIGPAIAVGLNIGSSIVTSNGISISGESVLLRDGNLITVPVLPMEPSDSSDAEGELLDSDKIPKIPVVVTLPQGISAEVSDGAESIIVPVCPVDHTKGKEVMNAVIPCNIDQLFTMLFTNSTFYLDFQVKRKTSDINQSDWQIGEGSQKSRQLTFTVVTGQTIGPRQAHVTETQTLLPASTPGLLYAIQSESVNSGIPYADCFSVNCHYCLTKLSETESNMVVIGKIQYKKSTWARTFIEKNSMSAMGDFFAALEKALKEECAKMNAGGVTPTSPIIGASMPRRRHPRKKMRAPDIPASAMNRPIEEQRKMVHAAVGRGGTLPSSASEAMSDAVMDGVEGSLVMKVILVVLGCLLLLNAFLYYKLSSLETAANMSVLYPPTIRFTGEAPQSHQEWLMLLQQQESLHISEINSWHEVLISAIKILHQAEKDLESLKSHISTYGKGNIAIVANPPSTDGTILGASRTSQSISNEKNLNQNVDQRNINTSKNSDSSDTGADVTRDSEKGKEK